MLDLKNIGAIGKSASQSVVASLRRKLALATAVVVSALCAPAMAALPTAVTPAGGAAAGDYMALLQQYWKSGVAVLVLMIGTYAFIEVGGGAVAKFGEWRLGKCELVDLKWFFLIGVLLLVAVVYLLTTANGIL